MRVTRRSFLGSAAAIPLATRFAPLLAASSPRVVVVGAGAFGGWTALNLRNLGADVVMVDSWGPGNARSSSGGDTRVIRAVYGADRIYVEMVKRAFGLWEQLQASTAESLYAETGALWMHRGDDAYVRAAAPILNELAFPVEKLTLAEARRRYPQINFHGIQSVWLEKRAGVLSAQRACVAVRNAFTSAGGTYQTAQVKPGRITNGSLPNVQLADGTRIEADFFVFACGPWLGKLFPNVLGNSIQATRQEVFYFGVRGRHAARYGLGQLPVWIDFGERIVYGIPAAPGRAFKVADDTRGEPVDPDSNRVLTKEGIKRVRRFLVERFPGLAQAPVRATHVCLYENSPDGHLIIDRHPEASNVWLVGGGSGHGFKLSPVVGEMTAQAMLREKMVPEMFRLARLRNPKKPATQFERTDSEKRDW